MTYFIPHPHDHKRAADWRGIFPFLDFHIPHRDLSSVLDLGAGMGLVAAYYAERSIDAVALDISPDFLTGIVSRNPRIRPICHNLNLPLPFPNRSFDAVFCFGTLPYASIQNPHAILAEIARVSRRYAAIDMFPSHSPYRFAESVLFPRYSPRRFSSVSAAALAASAGFRIVSAHGVRALPFLSCLAPFSGKSAILVLEKR